MRSSTEVTEQNAVDNWHAIWEAAENSTTAVNLAAQMAVSRRVANAIEKDDLPPHVRQLRVAILRTVTVETLHSVIIAQLARRDYAAQVDLGLLGNYQGEIFGDGSFLSSKKYDVCIVLTPLDTISPEVQTLRPLRSEIGRLLQSHFDGLKKLATTSAGLVIVCNFSVPPNLLAPRFRAQNADDYRYAVTEANRLLAELASSHDNMVISDIDRLVNVIGANQFYSARDYALAMQPYSVAGFSAVCDDWAELVRMSFRGTPKCVVVDCDNTLWGGIVGEDGLAVDSDWRKLPGHMLQHVPETAETPERSGFHLGDQQQEQRKGRTRGLREASPHGTTMGRLRSGPGSIGKTKLLISTRSPLS